MLPENTDELFNQVKQLSREPLTPEASERILHTLRRANSRAERQLKRKRTWRHIAVALAATCLFAIVVKGWGALPGPMGQEESSPTAPSTAEQKSGAEQTADSNEPANATDAREEKKPVQIDVPWQESPLFDLYDKDGSLVFPSGVRGVKGKIGFREDGGTPFIANVQETVAKMFWYVWGDADKLVGKQLVATAVHQESGKKITLDKSKLESGIYGEDASALTSFAPLTEKGLWRIDVTLDGNYFDSIVVRVKEGYVKTKTATFDISPDDLVVYKPLRVWLDVPSQPDKQKALDVRAFPLNERKKQRTFKFTSEDGSYSGTFLFDTPGKWQLEVLGEKTVVDVSSRHGWKVSPRFDLLDKDGSVVYPKGVRGIEGKVGFLDNGDVSIVAGASETVAKMFWYVWGDSKKLVGKQLLATAVHEETGEAFTLDRSELTNGLYGEDAHALTTFAPFPRKGLWRIDINIDGTHFASFVVNVKDDFIRTKSSYFSVSRDDVKVGKIHATLFASGEQKEKALDIRARSLNNDQRATFSLTKGGSVIRAMDNVPETIYEGLLSFPTPGEWELDVRGEKVVVNVGESKESEAEWRESEPVAITDAAHNVIFPDDVIGVPDKVGLTPTAFITKEPATGLKWYVNDPSKQYANKTLIATATHRLTGERVRLSKTALNGSQRGTFATTPETDLKPLPHKGVWRVDVTVGGTAIDSFTVEVTDE
ncbi:hypothetical protein [Numidum massiliense]|uniref:hypothetical protein n=1 Tax=Numidum massiliense TaxID=1522315 RepID=UPI0006D55502|nr:hypothetical protein [Numidum massiliense]